MSYSRNWQQALLIFPLLLALIACQQEPADSSLGAQGNTPATQQTASTNAKVSAELNLAEQQDFDNATRGLIAAAPSLQVMGANGSPIWDMPAYDFIQGAAPQPVAPGNTQQLSRLIQSHRGHIPTARLRPV